MPGITVSTGVRVGPTGADVAPAATLFLVGTAERGSLDKPRLILGVNQFEAIYGAYSGGAYSLYDSVKTFFEEGGTRCYVQRVAVTGADKAILLVKDDAGTPATVLSLTAASEGEWANSDDSPVKHGLEVYVTATAAPDTFSLEIQYQQEVIFTGGPYRDEDLADGSTKLAKTFAAEDINSSPALAEFLTAATGASNIMPDDNAGDPLFFTGGSADSDVADSDRVLGLGNLDYDFGPGAVAIPGANGSTIWDGLRDHAKANRRIALCSFAIGASKATVESDVADYYGTTTSEKADASYMAFYWPSVTVPDGYGGTRDISPEAFVAAARSRAHRNVGAWQPGAGATSAARYVSGLYTPVPKADGDELDAARINAIRVINGAVQVYGARSASADETNWRFITYRDTLNYVTAQCETALEPLVFRPIDGRGNLFGQIEAILTGIMDPIRAAGGVYEGFDPATGRQIDAGYSVTASSVNNPTNSLANGVVTADIGVRVSPVADQITVTITKSALNATV
jgi:hypothetical protein